MGGGGLFVSPRPGETTHVYDADTDPAGIKNSEYWGASLCGMSMRKTTKAKSLAANRGDIDCGTCERILSERKA